MSTNFDRSAHSLASTLQSWFLEFLTRIQQLELLRFLKSSTLEFLTIFQHREFLKSWFFEFLRCCIREISANVRSPRSGTPYWNARSLHKIGRVKNAPDHEIARCDITVCAHDVLKCTDYPIKSVGLRMHRTMIVQGARLGFARTPWWNARSTQWNW